MEKTEYYEVTVRKVTKIMNTTETSGGSRIDTKTDSDELYSQNVVNLDLEAVIAVVNGLVKKPAA